MASSSSAPPSKSSPPLASYTTMDREVGAIGAHCEYTYCHQLDFLPFRCESCKGMFCLDHRTESGHSCPKAGAWAQAKNQSTLPGNDSSNNFKPNVRTSQQCSHPSCKTFVNTPTSVGVTCTPCNRTYCLKHRLREDHDCANLVPLGVATRTSTGGRLTGGASQTTDKAKAALSRLRAWGKEKQAAAATTIQPASKTQRAAAAAAEREALMNLKKTAKGDGKTEVERRVYLYVEAEAAPTPTGDAATSTTASTATTARQTPPKGNFYYSRDWTVGRMLDAAAKSLRVENVNNRRDGEESRLRVFHVEKGRVLEFSERIGECCRTGETVVLLRGVGAG